MTINLRNVDGDKFNLFSIGSEIAGVDIKLNISRIWQGGFLLEKEISSL